MFSLFYNTKRICTRAQEEEACDLTISTFFIAVTVNKILQLSLISPYWRYGDINVLMMATCYVLMADSTGLSKRDPSRQETKLEMDRKKSNAHK